MLEREKQNREKFMQFCCFLTPLCCFAGIKMQKGGNRKRGRFQGALAYLIAWLLSLNRKYTFLFPFLNYVSW
jgi:hypothetical protein